MSIVALLRKVAIVSLLLGLPAVATADVTLPAVFSDHMVLQRDVELPVWGWADAGEEVTVRLGDAQKTATADDKGNWSLRFWTRKEGGPLTLTVEGKNRIEIQDVLVGEVWVCSGQSNMAMSVSRSANFADEQAAADHPQIRMFTVTRKAAEEPQDRCSGNWQVCSPDTVGGFSATAYFFGRELHQELDVPVGLINTSWGGTPVQAWTSYAVQSEKQELQSLLDDWKQRVADYEPEAAKERYEKQLAVWQEKAKKAKDAGKRAPRRPQAPTDPRLNPHHPGALFNGMVAPLVPYAMRGAIWYQGESNANRYASELYGMQLQLMIKDWRRHWNDQCPFLWVQLPNYKAPQQAPVETSGWVIVQEQMLKSLALSNTGMAITIDVGEEKDIHPKNKQDVGKRLALWALGTTYDKPIVYSGPIYERMFKKEGQIIVRFKHTGDGLVARGEKLKGFAIAGEDKQFVFADAKILGDAQVVVSSAEVKNPVAVRYAWASNPDCNLYNSAGLPASPFRTDTWKE